MKSLLLVQLAASAAGFILPNEQLNHLQHVQLESRPAENAASSFFNKVASSFEHLTEEIQDSVEDLVADVRHSYKDTSSSLLDQYHQLHSNAADTLGELSQDAQDILNSASEMADGATHSMGERLHEYHFRTNRWIEEAREQAGILDAEDPMAGGMGHHHHHHHHDPHHGKPNMTIYQLISKSNYTTKLAKLVNEYPDLVDALNSTKTNITVFAPMDSAFDKIPKDAPKPSKSFLKKLLMYHVSPEFYPAGRVLVSRTIPTLFLSGRLSDKEPQRIVTDINLRGLTANFYSRIFPIDIFATNGVIHGLDSLLIPPPMSAEIVDLLPGEFSTLELALVKTDLFERLNSTNKPIGGTFFAPSNFAFQLLGPRVNAFLFSEYGRKYLTALLKYHYVPGVTLYSDAYYKGRSESNSSSNGIADEKIPRGFFHTTLHSFLGKTIDVAVARYGRLIQIRLNSYVNVATSDVVARDGVIHVLSSVLIPPKELADGTLEHIDAKDVTVEQLKDVLEPYVEHEEKAWSDDL